MVLVTHDSTVARRAQRIGVMKNGRLTFKQPARAKARPQAAPSSALSAASAESDEDPAGFVSAEEDSAGFVIAGEPDSISFPD